MGLLSMFAKAGIAKRVIDEARKPANQQKVKDMVAKVRGQDGPGDAGGQGGAGGQGDAGGPGIQTGEGGEPSR